MIGRITDGYGLDYCVPLDIYVQHNYIYILYQELEIYLRKIYASGYEKNIGYIRKQINEVMPAKLRKANSEKATLEQRRDYLKANVEWKEAEIEKLLKKILDSNKLGYQYADFQIKIHDRMLQEMTQANRARNYERKELYDKFHADEDAQEKIKKIK